MAKIVNIESWYGNRFKPFIMKANNPTDQIFRERLGNIASEPPMHIWERIDAKRSAKHRVWMRFKRNWGFAVLVLLLIGATGFFMSDNQDSTAILAETHIENQIQTQESNSTATENNHSNSDSNINSELNKNSETPLVENQTNVIEIQNIQSKQTQNIANQSLTQNQVSKPTTKPIEQSNFSKTINTSAKNNTLTDQNKTENINLDTPIENQFTAFKTTEKSRPLALTAEDVHTPQIPNSLPRLTSDLNFETEIPQAKVKKYRAKKKKNDPKKGCPEIERGKKFNFYMDAVVGPDFANRILRPKDQDKGKNYMDERERSESYRYAYSGGIRFSALNRRGLALRTGIMYNQINEKLDVELPNSLLIIISPHLNPDGSIWYDTIYQPGDKFITAYNRFHIIDFPILFGYETHYGKWAYGFNAGTSFNIMFEQKGKFFTPDGVVQSFTSGDPDAYKAFRNNLGMSIFGSISIHYKLNKNFRILFEPHFKYYRKSFSRDDYILDQQYFTVGVLTGMRMKF